MGSESAVHWQRIYRTRPTTELSWYEPVPQVSLDLIGATELPVSAPIIDIGGGDSRVVDHVLDGGYEDVTVLDVASAALERAQGRLGARATRVEWIAADLTAFQPGRPYALWHDRAVFHFLVATADRQSYLRVLTRALAPGGHLILGTFGPQGPTQCSGLPVQRYSEHDLSVLLGDGFQLRSHRMEDHRTPAGQGQQFLWTWWQAAA